MNEIDIPVRAHSAEECVAHCGECSQIDWEHDELDYASAGTVESLRARVVQEKQRGYIPVGIPYPCMSEDYRVTWIQVLRKPNRHK